MSASPLYRITFTDGSLTHLRGNAYLWRVTPAGKLSSCTTRDVRPGDAVKLDPLDPPRVVTGVERLPPRHAGGGGRERAD